MTARPLVLVVDDDALLRRVLTQALEAEGWRVVVAANGLQALDVLRGILPSAVVLDLCMPDVDGWQFLDCYEHLTGVKLPVVVASAEMSAHTATRLRDMGVHSCLTKPFELDEIIECIRQALESRSSPVAQHARTEDGRWDHIRDLTEMVTTRLDGSHRLLIRAEDALGWSTGRILAYYSDHGLLDGATPDPLGRDSAFGDGADLS